ncbi:hypothetical protein E2562_008431 [Oryza meyeriana var. granulata]|uniref:Uncharacterized protein n=1 Tax=Oryza meyeriana var. granulata TaxID=110450 RepID=A0A6G1EI72_9ORYZ|nr:hypothetical protein E2562_008431 [Oryza meyeriana var. granulata]
MAVAAMPSRAEVWSGGCSGHTTVVGGLGCFGLLPRGMMDKRNKMSRLTLGGCGEGRASSGRCGRLGGAGEECGRVEAEWRLGRGRRRG